MRCGGVEEGGMETPTRDGGMLVLGALLIVGLVERGVREVEGRGREAEVRGDGMVEGGEEAEEEEEEEEEVNVVGVTMMGLVVVVEEEEEEEVVVEEEGVMEEEEEE